MYVCICNGITDKQIRKAASAGVHDLVQLQSQLGVAAGCGTCRDVATSILSECRTAARNGEPVLYCPSAG